jgi:hypothetical protein
MRIGLCLLLVALASPAVARDITVTLTDAEAQTIINDLDIATKSGGLQIAIGALPIVQKIQAAAQSAPSLPLQPPEKK